MRQIDGAFSLQLLRAAVTANLSVIHIPSGDIHANRFRLRSAIGCSQFPAFPRHERKIVVAPYDRNDLFVWPTNVEIQPKEERQD
jgi:hypothetical protein